MRKAIWIAVILFLSGVQLLPIMTEQKQRQQILAATVMISITTPNWRQPAQPAGEALPIPNDEYRPMARADGNVVADGLGTVMVDNGEKLLLTHDHWSRFDAALGKVVFRDAHGALLGQMDLRAFRQLLRYRDGGTMVLRVPVALAATTPARGNVRESNNLRSGNSVLLAQRFNGRVMLTEATVVAHDEKQDRPVVRLQSSRGQEVSGGDSGGGVWINGRLAATLWTTVMMENRADGELRATDFSIAALVDPPWEGN